MENAQYTDIPFYNLEYGPVYILKGYEYLNKNKLNKTLEKLNQITFNYIQIKYY